MVKVSIIMPVYNDEEFLSESIDSVIKQSLDDLELICVNDGSTDNSLGILNDYANNFDYIKVFTKKNEGSGKARNFALQKATGEYIAYLDSDDFFMDENALERMYETAIKYDSQMVSANLKVYSKGKLVINNNLDRFDREKIITPDEYGIPYSFYKNIFKREMLIDNNINFPDLLRGQDPVFLAEIFTLVDEIPAIPVELYAYRSARNNVLLKINTYRKKYDYIKHFKETFDILEEAGFHEMKTNYESKLTYYIKSLHNSYSKEIKDIVYDVFADDEHILNLLNDYFINPKISVLISVYNAEYFLDKSIPSILNQSLKEIELVCVNDGSKDNSLEILNDYALKDSRVRVIDNENEGCGSARNRALDEAVGDYIYFFDPDDYIEKNTFKQAYKSAIANDSDMVIFKADTFDDNGIDKDTTFFNLQRTLKDVDNFDEYAFDYHEVKDHVLKGGFAPWSKLYKKEFLDSYDDFRFNTGLAFDDVPFHVKSMLRAKRLSFVNKVFYHYRVDNANSVNSTSSNGFDIFKIIDIVKEFLISENYFDEFVDDFYSFEVNQILLYIISTNSTEYYDIARKRFGEIEEQHIPKIRDRFDLVMATEDYTEFKFKFTELKLYNERNKLNKQIDKLKNKNKKLIDENNNLKNENNKLKELNESLLNSKSWKMTKPLRKIKNLR